MQFFTIYMIVHYKILNSEFIKHIRLGVKKYFHRCTFIYMYIDSYKLCLDKIQLLCMLWNEHLKLSWNQKIKIFSWLKKLWESKKYLGVNKKYDKHVYSSGLSINLFLSDMSPFSHQPLCPHMWSIYCFIFWIFWQLWNSLNVVTCVEKSCMCTNH